MSSSHDKASEAAGDTQGAKADAKGGKPGARGQDMGQALRSVYQRTVEESVPDEMLDLLGKLG